MTYGSRNHRFTRSNRRAVARNRALKRVLRQRCPAGTREARLFFSDRTVYMEVSAKRTTQKMASDVRISSASSETSTKTVQEL